MAVRAREMREQATTETYIYISRLQISNDERAANQKYKYILSDIVACSEYDSRVSLMMGIVSYASVNICAV